MNRNDVLTVAVAMVDDNRIHDDMIADADIKITANFHNQPFLYIIFFPPFFQITSLVLETLIRCRRYRIR